MLFRSLKRFDALGGSSAIFYLRENDALATVNKVESKMLSGILKNGEIDHVYYFESPKNNAFPVVQLPEAEKRMKGFNWREEEKPKGPEDITTLKVKPSERAKYAARPKARSSPNQRKTPRCATPWQSGIRFLPPTVYAYLPIPW